VLDAPEPLVLADALAASTVNLRFFFWYDGSEHDGRKVRSALIRNVKRALESGGFSMPDEAREVIFPDGVPILQASARPSPEPSARPAQRPVDERAALAAEGGLDAEQHEIQAQAAEARSPEEGDDLLAENPRA
ncbi:MAG: mechanosensitive ion channel protein MscS, partial [Myxococcales bacterium]|nr:mechanosensitive ion channel protein MscS [Myxococcales bacterium]